MQIHNSTQLPRDQTLDIAKGLAVIFMVYVHVLITFGSTYLQEESSLGLIIGFLGGIPAAPVFMFMLGVGVQLSTRSTPRVLAKRGIMLFFGGYLLNFFRAVLPEIIKYLFWDDYPLSLTEVGYYYLLFVDILQFAGLAFLFFALSKRFKIKAYGYFLLLLMFLSINSFLLTQHFSYHFWLNPFYALWLGVDESSFFPFFSWIFYPILGYLFAILSKKIENKKVLYGWIWITTSAIMTLYIVGIWLWSMPSGYQSDSAYYHHAFPVHILYGSFIGWWLSLIFFTIKIIKKQSIFLSNTSKMTNLIYIIHWILLGWLSIFIQDIKQSWALLLFSTIVFLLSYYLAKIWIARRTM